MTFLEILFSELKEKILAMSYFLGGEVEEFFNEEFSFENLNNMTSGNGLKILKRY